MLPEFARRIAACAPKTQVKVSSVNGAVYVVPDAPTPVEEQVAKIVAVSAEDVKALQESITRFGETIVSATAVETDLSEAVKRIATVQEAIVSNIEKIAETLALPVRPIYDAKGKLIEARRVIPGG